MKIVIIIICVISLILASFQPALAYSVTFESGTPLKHGPPLVCVFEPDYETHSVISGGISSMMLKETRGAIDHWENMLKEHERSRADQQKWEITYKEISFKDQKTFDTTPCSVLIRFLAMPHLLELWYESLGTTEYMDDESRDFRLISIFYVQVSRCETHRDANYIYYKPCYLGGEIIQVVQIGNTVRHEFGHALGLGHYFADDEEVNNEWSTLQVSPPSIMVTIGSTIMREQEIKQIDIEKIREIYGQNGFLQIPNPQTEIPSWIKNNAGWWSEGSVGDTDFVQVIQYLIKQKIINIPETKSSIDSLDQKIPSWIKKNAGWWASGQISEGDFIIGIQYLIEHGTIKI